MDNLTSRGYVRVFRLPFNISKLRRLRRGILFKGPTAFIGAADRTAYPTSVDPLEGPCKQINFSSFLCPRMIGRGACFATFGAILVACSNAADVEGAKAISDRPTDSQVIFIPGETNVYAQHDIQLRTEIENEYLMSWFTWTGKQPVFGISFRINLDDLSAGPRYDDNIEYDTSPSLVLVSVNLADRDMLDTQTNPENPRYSPSIRIGDKPIVGQVFGLDYRYNVWADFKNRPKNELYTRSDLGRTTLIIMCREGLDQGAMPVYCTMQFPLFDVQPDASGSEFAPFVSVSMQKSKLAEWNTISEDIGAFLRERSRIVPFRKIEHEGIKG